MKRKIKIIFILFVLFILYIYIANITLFPKNILLMQGERISLKRLWGINIIKKENSNPNIASYQEASLLQATSALENSNIQEIGKLNLKINLFQIIPLKEVSVNIIPKMKVVPLGDAIGLKLYTEGVLIVGMTEIEGKKPYANTGMKEGDRIVAINNKKINSTEDLIQTVNQSNGQEIAVKYVRNEVEETTSIVPTKAKDNSYKIGLWVRDAAAGVGTATFYVPSTGMFASLGHGITDIDTEKLITISNGELVTTNIISIQKGEKGKPGEIRGSIEGGRKIGDVYKNTNFGIFGKITNKMGININDNELEILNRNEIKTGKAEIICELEEGNKKNYEIEIQKVYTNNQKDNKSMLIKVTDKELLEKTGGIIQRNVRIAHYTERKVCRGNYTCNGKQSTNRICSICGYDAKTNANEELGARP